MNWLQPKLNLRIAQKQILTPGLVQMVSVLALNRLELREMINQEIMANPVLEELGEDGVIAEVGLFALSSQVTQSQSYIDRARRQEGARAPLAGARQARPHRL